MCPMNLSEAGVPTTDAFVTRDLSLSSGAALVSVCPAGMLPGPVTIQVDASLFEPDVPYIAFTARTDGSTLRTPARCPRGIVTPCHSRAGWTPGAGFVVHAAQLFNSDGGTPEAKGAYLNMDIEPHFSLRSRDERTRRLGASIDPRHGPRRRLLKGSSRSSYSYSSGRTYRSSYSASGVCCPRALCCDAALTRARRGVPGYNTWGNSIVTRRTFSRTGVAAITASTVVTVRSLTGISPPRRFRLSPTPGCRALQVVAASAILGLRGGSGYTASYSQVGRWWRRSSYRFAWSDVAQR